MQQQMHRLIDLALEEDIGCGDITTEPIVAEDATGEGVILCKEEGVILAGLFVAKAVFRKLDPTIRMEIHKEDGAMLGAGDRILSVSGSMRALLMGERTALNFLQRLSGIATHVHGFLEPLGESRTTVVDTRKTTPGWRSLEKYAVRTGGGHNHRMGLYDGVLIKDNHIAAAGGIAKAVSAVRKRVSHLVKIEVETTTLAEVDAALTAKADIIMLDNMDTPTIRKAVAMIDGRAQVEASGMVNRERLAELCDAGVDIISAGALTHQARAVDLSMRITG